MWRFLSACLLLSSVLLGCKYQPLPKYSEPYNPLIGWSSVGWVQQPGLYQYDASFTRKESTYTGIFYFKTIDSNQVKIAMTTDMGFKLFDLLLTRYDIQWNYVYPDMDKALIKNVLERELRTLLLYVPLDSESWAYPGNPEHERIHWQNEKIYFYPDSNQTGRYNKIQLVKNNKVQVEVLASGFRLLVPEGQEDAAPKIGSVLYYIPDQMILKDHLAKTTLTLKRKI